LVRQPSVTPTSGKPVLISATDEPHGTFGPIRDVAPRLWRTC